MPLSAYGLWEALSTTARSRPWRVMSSGAAGVGRIPPVSAAPPASAMPAATAASSISPDSRGSRMMSTRGWDTPIRWVAARASASARSALRKSPTGPRTPSVPNSRLATTPTLTLRELRPLAGLLEAGLLALLGPRVAGQEAAALELAAQVRVGHDQRARDPMPQRAGLGRDAAAVQPGMHVHARLVAHRLERLADVALQGLGGEEVLERGAVDRGGALAAPQHRAREGGLALAGGGVAGPGGEVDRGLRDRALLALDGPLVVDLDDLLDVIHDLDALGQGRLGGRAAQRVKPLGDDVGLEVGAGDDVGAGGLRLVAVARGRSGGGRLVGGRGGSFGSGRSFLRGRSFRGGRSLFCDPLPRDPRGGGPPPPR